MSDVTIKNDKIGSGIVPSPVPEILAPAGTEEAMKAAVSAGCDAVYLGGDLFSARAFAGNFDTPAMLRTIDYCHLFDVKLYMTVNTLLKDDEIGRLVTYMRPFYEAGLDGVIVQDVGVVRTLKEAYPDLPLHGSTQMSVSSAYGARFLKRCGLTRVVPARELSLAEIRSIRETADIEIETFIHGAMCYAYSGKCLFSSFAGGRSGNRGRCAQPCRQCYEVMPENILSGKGRSSAENALPGQGRSGMEKNGINRSISSGNPTAPLAHEYIMSLKDMCTLSIFPQLIDAGIISFKIEGRMKNPYYVAATVDAYRQARDYYLELLSELQGKVNLSHDSCDDRHCEDSTRSIVHGPADDRDLEGSVRPTVCWEALSKEKQQDYLTFAGKLTEEMQDIYNRGGFHTGYYVTDKGLSMTAVRRPNHTGIRIGTIERVQGPEVYLKLERELQEQDVLEIIDTGTELTSNKTGRPGSVVSLKGKELKRLHPGMEVYRTRNNHLLNGIEEHLIRKERKVSAHANIIAQVGKPLTITITGFGAPMKERNQDLQGQQDHQTMLQGQPEHLTMKQMQSEHPVTLRIQPDQPAIKQMRPGYQASSPTQSKLVRVMVQGTVIEAASSRPTTQEQLIEKMGKTGGTHVELSVTCVTSPDAFVPMSEFNALRREAIERYKEALVKRYRRISISS